MRVSEVLLGIVVAAAVSDLVFPERLRVVLRATARVQFTQFIDFVRGSTGGSIPRAHMEQARWVRPAQRVPVRIAIDSNSLPADSLLAAGMTATVEMHPRLSSRRNAGN